MTTTPIQPVKETLDDLEQQLELVIQYLESDNPEEKAIASAIFEDLEPLLEKKIDGYVARINCLKANRNFRQSESQRIASLAKHDAAAIAWLTDKLLGFMERRVQQLGERGRKLEGKLSKTPIPLLLLKTITSTPQSVECDCASRARLHERTSNAEEEGDDREKEWYEMWDYSHIGDTDIDLHY